MATTLPLARVHGPHLVGDTILAADVARVILSFDVEEHFRIEAAAGLEIDAGLRTHYGNRLDVTTRWLLDELARRDIRATFFIVGQVARHNPSLVRAIHQGGHEVASHSWEHRRVHHFTPATFREDVHRAKDALEQVIGAPVRGFRAPTFSIGRATAWAIDVLAEAGMSYDSSIFPIRHDRYGIPHAPRVPFLARGRQHTLLELPPATLRLLGYNLPVAGGGYFRLLPRFLLRWALWQLRCRSRPAVATLYFHPWEFDPAQARLPLPRLNNFRTYVGLNGNADRFAHLLGQYRFARALDIAHSLTAQNHPLTTLQLEENHHKGHEEHKEDTKEK